MFYKKIEKCRICGNKNLASVLHLGDQALTGYFPKSKDQFVEKMPLELVKCEEDGSGATCGLLQLAHTGDLSQLYGENYGYRSSLNASMVKHLRSIVATIRNRIQLAPGDLVLDIGSNDSTLLQGYTDAGIDLIGIDPTGKKFKEYYPAHIKLVPDFFTTANFKKAFPTRKAKVITSISMFYDLEEPMAFMRDIHECLDDNGIWVLEQSYMPTMLEMNSYDTICHEHLEYYGLKQIQWMAERIGFKILDVELNGINGGSFQITVAKKASRHAVATERVSALLRKEEELKLHTLAPFQAFKERTFQHRDELKAMISKIRASGKKVFGLGASTKGNVILQFCGFTPEDVPYVAEVNTDKFGAFTPGTLLPIISEEDAKGLHPDFFLVLPWHFRDTFLSREKAFMQNGGKLIFPLPSIQAIG